MKSHMQRHVNEGHDVTTAEDMVVALNSFGVVRGYYAAVLILQPASSYSVDRPGVTTYMNFAYELEGVFVGKE